MEIESRYENSLTETDFKECTVGTNDKISIGSTYSDQGFSETRSL